MFGLRFLDLLVIAAYFGAIIAIGIRSALRIKNQEDYLLGGRKFGKLIQTFASFGQATSADQPVGVATTTFHNGASGAWSALLLVFFTPVFWITSPWLRRMRLLTMGDFYEERYGSKKMAATYALIATFGMMGLLSVGYTAMSKTVLAITPKSVAEYSAQERREYDLAQEMNGLENRDFNLLTEAQQARLHELRLLNPQGFFSYNSEALLVWIVCVITIMYAATGGLEAAFYTDMLQGSFIIVLSVILIPFSWSRISRIYGDGNILSAPKILHQHLPQSFFEIFGSPSLIDFTWYFIIAASLVAGVTVVTQPNQLVTNAAAKDEHSARMGFVTGVFMKRFCTILWAVVGLAATLLYTGKVQDSDLIWGYATHDLLGPVGFGLIGLMVASMMAALMSAASSLMLTVSGLLLHNIYRPLVPGKSEKHYVWAGRMFGGLFLIGAAMIALQFNDVFELLKFIWSFFVIFAAAFWLGLKWRRATRLAAWSSIVSTLFIFYIIPLAVPSAFPSLRTNTWMLLETHPSPVTRSYAASESDVELRNKERANWESLDPVHKASVECPPALKFGETFSKKYQLPSRAIFWSKQPVMNEKGVFVAQGSFFPELVVLHFLGFNLQDKPYALLETITMIVPLVFSFLVLVVVTLFTVSDHDERALRFFLKMRTKVRGLGPEADAVDLKNAFDHPDQTEKLLLFRGTNWEIYRWNRQDILGFLASIAIVFVVLGTLYAVVSIY